MRRFFHPSVALLSFAFGQSAQACNVEAFEPSDVQYADVVVIGRISNYRVIPNASPGGDYGKFDVAVEKVLKGDVGKTFAATYRRWTPCCFGPRVTEVLPEQLPSQRHLIAFRKPNPRHRVLAPTDSSLLTLDINECIGPFLMKMPTWFAKDAEQYLARHKERRGGQLPKR